LWFGWYSIFLFSECDLIPTLPDLTFVFGGKNYTLTSSEYILNMGGSCMSAIQGMDLNVPGGDLWIIGRPL
jgi:saccharopepsin